VAWKTSEDLLGIARLQQGDYQLAIVGILVAKEKTTRRVDKG
jgi:hypothetical protein